MLKDKCVWKSILLSVSIIFGTILLKGIIRFYYFILRLLFYFLPLLCVTVTNRNDENVG